MPDQGRFLLDGVHFAWWIDDGALLSVASAALGKDQLRLRPGENSELAAQQLAMRMVLAEERPAKVVSFR